MIELYYFPGNANLAPHILLEELGVPHRLVLVDRGVAAHKSAAYLELNPHGRLPTLVDGDLILFETAAICLHLADTHLAAHLAPALGSAERAHFYKWLIYLTNTVQAELLIYFYPEKWSVDPAEAGRLKQRAEARVADMFDHIEASLAAHGGAFLLGETYSAVDPYLFMLSRWTRLMTRPARVRPVLGRYLAGLAERPALQRAFAAEGIAAPFY
ncbi:MAG: glutathione S-transferase N-terminal domain-containing protein [Herminiimonas sp.]|nr:glutathione S-transferase N-terminal domain-containing protein [Herminiimonas sp.]